MPKESKLKGVSKAKNRLPQKRILERTQCKAIVHQVGRLTPFGNDGQVIPFCTLCYNSLVKRSEAAVAQSEFNAPGSSNSSHGDVIQDTEPKVTKYDVDLSACVEECRTDMEWTFGEIYDVPSADAQIGPSTAESQSNVPDQNSIMAQNQDSMSCFSQNSNPGILPSNGENGNSMWSASSGPWAIRDHGYWKTEASSSDWQPDSFYESTLKAIRERKHPDSYNRSPEEGEPKRKECCLRLMDQLMPGRAGRVQGQEQPQPEPEPIASTSSGKQADPNGWKREYIDDDDDDDYDDDDDGDGDTTTASEEEDFMDFENISQDVKPVESAGKESDMDSDSESDSNFESDSNSESDSKSDSNSNRDPDSDFDSDSDSAMKLD
ncbi:clumping factor A-like [Drosophila elegans]|uniref:clumping factor A-like n=1 Tax=Drosophila elegans TaxID=30023 RepID=UPI0007E70231|nr:clumping factor A-like [Drosophila elegans]